MALFGYRPRSLRSRGLDASTKNTKQDAQDAPHGFAIFALRALLSESPNPSGNQLRVGVAGGTKGVGAMSVGSGDMKRSRGEEGKSLPGEAGGLTLSVNFAP